MWQYLFWGFIEHQDACGGKYYEYVEEGEWVDTEIIRYREVLKTFHYFVDEQVEVGCIELKVPFGKMVFEPLLEPGYFLLRRDLPSMLVYSPQGLFYASPFSSIITSDETENLDDGIAREVEVLNGDGSRVTFQIETGESEGCPEGVMSGATARLKMLDANDLPVTENPVYYEIDFGTGTKSKYSVSTKKLVSLISPNGVNLHADDKGVGIEIIYDENNALRQVKSAADGLADIVIVDEYKYEIRLYAPENVGGKVDGIYQTTGTYHTVWTIANPDQDHDKLDNPRFTKTANGKSDIYDWKYIDASNQWTLTEGNGLRTTSKSKIWDSSHNNQLITLETRDSDENIVSQKTENVHEYSFGERVNEKIVDPNGLNLKTQIEYFDDSSETGKYSNIQSELYPDGSWVKYDYDSNGRKILEIRPFKDSFFGSSADQAQAYYFSYTPVDSQDIALDNDTRPRIVEHKILGITVLKTFLAYKTVNNEKVEIIETAVTPSSAYGDANNLKKVTTYYASSESYASAGRIKSIEFPNGTKMTKLYEYGTFTSTPDPANCSFSSDSEGSDLRLTIINGTTSYPDGIANKTTKEVFVIDSLGNRVFLETYVYDGTSYQRIDWIRRIFDSEHHVVHEYFSNNTELEMTWNCCNKESEKTEEGIENTYAYDLLNRVSSMTKKGDETQPDLVTNYTYDTENRLLSKAVSGGTLTLQQNYEYDLFGRLTKKTLANGLNETYAYQTENRITTITLPGGFTQITEKYLDGKVKSVTGSAVIPRYYTYGVNSDGTQWEKVTIGNTTESAWVKTNTDALDRTVKDERPGYNGTTIVTEYTYNNLGQMTKVSTTGLADTLYVYDELGNQIRSGLDIDGNGSLDLSSNDRINDSETVYVQESTNWWIVSTYKTYATSNDATATTTGIRKNHLTGLSDNMVSESISIDIHGNQTTNTTSIDRTNKTVTQTIDTPNSTVNSVSTSVNGLQTSVVTGTNLTYTYFYDDLGRQTGVTAPRTGSSNTTYYTSGTGKVGKVYTVTNAAGNTTTYDYDPTTGRKISVTNALSKSTAYTYNDRGQILTVRGDASYPLDYVYDSYGRITQLKTYRNEDLSLPDVTTWNYEEATGLLLSKTDANSKSVTYTYDSANRLSTRTWSRGIVTTYGYDSNTGELTSVDYSDSTADLAYTYNRLGQQLTVTDALGYRTFAYNSALQLSTETISGLYNKVITRSYETTGMVGRYSGMNIGTEYDVDYGYDAYGRFSTLTNGGDVYTYSYLANSNLVSSITYPNNIKVENTYESNRDLITQVKNTFNTSTIISQYDYVNDALGRRTSMGKSGTAFTTSDTITYGYNDRSEVISAVSTNAATYNYGYSFDAIGNRQDYTNYESGSAVTSAYTTDNLNQYTAITNPTNAPTYDDDGDMLTNGDWTYTWNAENRLIIAEKSDAKLEFTYDFIGKRVEKKIYSGSTENWTLNKHLRFVYDNYEQIEELDALNSNAILKKRIWSSGKIIYDIHGATRFYAIGDANKNITEYLDNTGSIQNHKEYSPFGKKTVDNGSMAGEFAYGFSSEYFDTETSLVYYNYRYYSPKLGRWLNLDPIEEQSNINLYTMVENDPQNYWDYLGRESVKSKVINTALEAIGSKSTFKELKKIKGTPYLKDPSSGKILRIDMGDAAHGETPHVHFYDNMEAVKKKKTRCKIFTDKSGAAVKSIKILGLALVGINAINSLDAVSKSPHFKAAYNAAKKGDKESATAHLRELALDVSLSSGTDVPLKMQAAHEAGMFDFGLKNNLDNYNKMIKESSKEGLWDSLKRGIKEISDKF
jgi:RHS repeat-associated protein